MEKGDSYYYISQAQADILAAHGFGDLFASWTHVSGGYIWPATSPLEWDSEAPFWPSELIYMHSNQYGEF